MQAGSFWRTAHLPAAVELISFSWRLKTSCYHKRHVLRNLLCHLHRSNAGILGLPPPFHQQRTEEGDRCTDVFSPPWCFLKAMMRESLGSGHHRLVASVRYDAYFFRSSRRKKDGGENGEGSSPLIQHRIGPKSRVSLKCINATLTRSRPQHFFDTIFGVSLS